MTSSQVKHRRMVEAIVKATPEWKARADAERAWRNAGLVYIVQHGAGGLIKIGFSHNVDDRMKALQIVSPLPLRLLGWRHGGFDEEQRIHRLFDGCVAWGEWYRPMPELIEFVNTQCEHGHHAPIPRRSRAEERALHRVAHQIWETYGRSPKPNPAAAVSGDD